MHSSSYSVDQVPYSELLASPVWEFLPEASHNDETWIQPVRTLPVLSLSGRLVASPVRLANGQTELAILGNISLNDSMLNEHFLTLSIVKPSGERFHLARYHDISYSSLGPDALATFVGLTVDEVFPIEYDLATIASGVPSCLRGSLQIQPNVRLSRAELISMAI